MTPSRLKAYIALLITAIIWGIAAPVIKYTLDFIDPVSFLFHRFFISAVVLLFIFKLSKEKFPQGKELLKLSLLGVLGSSLGLGVLFWGIQYTTAVETTLIASMPPIFVTLGGALFLKEEITKKERIGLFLAVLGTTFIALQPMLTGKVLPLLHVWGNSLVFAYTLLWATYTLIVKKSEERYSPLTLTTITFLSGFLTITPIFLFQQLNFHRISTEFLPNPQAWPGILYMALFSSVIAYFTYNLGVSLIEASEATVFEYLKPIFAAPLAVLWLGESITPPFLLGVGIIALGVFFSEYKPARKSRF